MLPNAITSYFMLLPLKKSARFCSVVVPVCTQTDALFSSSAELTLSDFFTMKPCPS